MIASPGPAGIALELRQAWRRSDLLFEMLATDALFDRPIPLRHPFVFYLGHLPAFSWNQVMRGVLARPSFEPAFDLLFERGIDPLDAGAAREVSVSDWPPVDRILRYRDRIRSEVLESFDAVAARAGEDVLAAGFRIHRLVLEHEWMHHETLLYMLQELPLDRKRRLPGLRPPLPGGAPVRGPSRIPAGETTLGADFRAVPFGWDNEFPETKVEVGAFVLDALPVTNRAWREFVLAGGYEAREHWDADSWSWREAEGVSLPRAWSRDGSGRIRVRSLFDVHDLDDVLGWPVHVSHAEASAFARFHGARLPTEAEFHRAAYGAPGGGVRAFPWGDGPPDETRGAFDLRRFGPEPAGLHPAGRSAFGVDDLAGGGWEWTSTPFRPFPGFEAWARTYPGYSSDFFDDRHRVCLGASWATDRRLLRRSFRNWYQERYGYVFAKLRLVREET